MKPKTKSELMAEWDSQPGRLKKEREVKAVRKAMDDARAVMQDGLTRYVKKKTKARSMAKAEANPFAELEGWESMEQIQDAYGYGEITADRRDKLTDLWEAREAAQKQEEQQRGRKTLHMLAEKTIKETAPWELAWEDVQFGLEYYKQPLPGGAMFWKRIDQNRQHAGIMNYDDYAIILQDGKFFTCGWIPKISVIAELVRYFVLK
jgi:hypothetical protein|uniref:Uncharacterized protein n=1 Tax=Myoviridae sp. ctsIb3 TaxID=2825189 RepID=A0A8S5UR92_9CAUD|nr:MAG TPA: hypothetical protein [Myoviridae sp. ctsIb3]